MYRSALAAPAVLALLVAAAVPALPAAAPEPAPPPRAPWPMYGGSPSRNMVNLHDRLPPLPTKGPDGNDPAAERKWEAEWLAWKADLGSKSYSQPVVAGGRVYVGTNNQRPRNDRDTHRDKHGQVEPTDRGILMCFDEKTGAFLWQAVHDKLEGGRVNDWLEEGLCSIPTVVGDRVYYVSNRCTVVCADVHGFADGNQGFQGEKYQEKSDADVLWEYDMIRELKVFPHNMSTGCPLILGDLLLVQTSNGVDDGHINLPSPDAPSFICLDRNTGRLVWADNSPGKDVMHGQWASPAYAAEPTPQVIFPGGDGWLRAFDPPTGKLLWKFDCNPKDSVYELGGTGTRNDFIAAPVVHGGRAYIGVGQDPEHSTGIAWFWCVDLGKAVGNGAASPGRDVSPVLVVRRAKKPNGDPLVETRPNPASAVAWVYGGEETRKWAIRDFRFGRTMSTACVVDGLVYAPELAGYLHCLNATTGEHYWQYDTKSSVWASAYYADGKVFLPTDAGDLFVFRHDRKPEMYDEMAAVENIPTQKLARVEYKKVRAEVEKRYLVAKLELDAPMRGTPAVAGGRLYVATEKTLYAFGR